MADRGGGDAQAYVSEHNLNKAIANRKKLIERFTPSGPLDRHPGTVKRPVFPPWIHELKMRKEFKPHEQKLQYPYEDEEDIPEGILELLKKDPSFDLEEFKKIGWSTPENVWYQGGEGLQGVYYRNWPEGIKFPTLPKGVPPGEKLTESPYTRNRLEKVYVPPSGPPSERVWDPEKLEDPVTRTYSPPEFYETINLQHLPFKEDDRPIIANPNIPTSFVGSSRSSNVDKARTALHELRHKKFVENPEFWKSQPEWVQNVEMPGTEEYEQFGGKYLSGHELYNRFLDERYFPPMRDISPNEPYFDKILKDLWEPSAKEYDRILEARDLGERYAKGGLAKILGV